MVSSSFDIQLLDDTDPFEIDAQAAHLFKHEGLGLEDIYEVWNSDPLFFPAEPPAHWIMVAKLGTRTLAVPLAPSRLGKVSQCRPIGCYEAPQILAEEFRKHTK